MLIYPFIYDETSDGNVISGRESADDFVKIIQKFLQPEIKFPVVNFSKHDINKIIKEVINNGN